MTGQMSIYDFLPEYDPLTELAHRLVWADGCTPTRDRLARQLRDNDRPWDEVVRKECCPYGFSGLYLGYTEPEKLSEYEMTSNGIEIVYNDSEGTKRKTKVTWKKLAEAVRRQMEVKYE